MVLRRGGLVIAGLVSVAVYLIAAWRLSWWSYGGRLHSWVELLGEERSSLGFCLAGIGVLMAAYLWGWYVVRQGGGKRWVILGFAGLFAVTLFWLQPITSDLFSYLSRAHLLTDLRGNPLVDAPLDFEDALVQAYPTFYATRPTVYGPAWLLISAPGTLGRHDVVTGLLYLKGLAVVAFLGCVVLLEQILLKVRPLAGLEGLYLFAWNPLVLLLAVGDGHNDIVMMALVLLALWLLMREVWLLSFCTLALSAWIKYVSFVFFPLFALYAWRRLGHLPAKRRWNLMAEAGLVLVSVSLLAFAPFGGFDSLPGVAERILWPANWRSGPSDLAAWASAAGLVLFAVAFAILARWLQRGELSFQQLGDACFAASLLAVLLGAARSQPWHLIWPAALAGVSERRWAWAVVVGASVFMLGVQVWAEWGGAGVQPLS